MRHCQLMCQLWNIPSLAFLVLKYMSPFNAIPMSVRIFLQVGAKSQALGQVRWKWPSLCNQSVSDLRFKYRSAQDSTFVKILHECLRWCLLVHRKAYLQAWAGSLRRQEIRKWEPCKWNSWYCGSLITLESANVFHHLGHSWSIDPVSLHVLHEKTSFKCSSV